MVLANHLDGRSHPSIVVSNQNHLPPRHNRDESNYPAVMLRPYFVLKDRRSNHVLYSSMVLGIRNIQWTAALGSSSSCHRHTFKVWRWFFRGWDLYICIICGVWVCVYVYPQNDIYQSIHFYRYIDRWQRKRVSCHWMDMDIQSIICVCVSFLCRIYRYESIRYKLEYHYVMLSSLLYIYIYISNAHTYVLYVWCIETIDRHPERMFSTVFLDVGCSWMTLVYKYIHIYICFAPYDIYLVLESIKCRYSVGRSQH